MHKGTNIAYHFINSGTKYNQKKLKTEKISIKLIQLADWKWKQPTKTDRAETEKAQTHGCNAWS